MRRSVRHPWRVLLLVAIAAALNVISIPLPGELQLFLAPLAYMPLVLLLPLPWAALAAALPMAVTIFTLEQPFVFFIATAEAAWLAVAHRHWRRATVFHDAIFWLVAGVPAFGGLYRVIGHLPTDVVAIIAIKQIFNQLVAVVTAVFVLRYTRLASWIADRSVARRCLRDTVLLSTSVLALAPLVAVAFGLSVLLRVYCEREDREMLLGGASRMARHFGLYLQLHEATVASIANTLSRGAVDPALLLDESRRAHPAFITMLVTDAEGRIIAAAPAEALKRAPETNISDREYFRRARDDNRSFVSGVFRGRGFGRDVIVAISAPWHTADGRFGGVVEGSLEVRDFARLVIDSLPEDGVDFTFADASGCIIFSESRALRPLESLRPFPQGALLEPAAAAEGIHFDQPDERGDPIRYTAYAAEAREGVRVIAQRPLLAALEGSGWLCGIFAIVAAGTLGIAAWVTRSVRRRTAAPLEHFAEQANRQAILGEAEAIENPFADVPYEVWMVFRTFNQLATKLRRTYARLRQTNEELDRRVAQRTADAEAARRQAEAANESKTSFLAQTGHEIRTPLNAMLGHTEVLLENTSDPAARDRLFTIRNAGHRLLNVLNDLLDLSKIEAGKLDLHPAAVDVHALCREIVALFTVQASRAGLHLELELTGAAPLWVECDGPRLQQVLINLVSNALKFTRAGRVVIGLETLATGDTHTTLRLAVRDTGPGISAEQRMRLFQPYVQLEGSTTKGTGLGLAISRQLVELMGGELQLCSEPGHGAEFFFTLVLRAATPPAPANPPPRPAAEQPAPRVLVADDDLANQEVVRSHLESRCARLEIVASAEAARAALAAGEFDVALIDLEMPDGDGCSVARAARRGSEHGASLACRLIAFSAHRREDVWARCAEAGFDDFVEKPVTRAALLRAVLAAPLLVAAG